MMMKSNDIYVHSILLWRDTVKTNWMCLYFNISPNWTDVKEMLLPKIIVGQPYLLS